MFRHVLFSTHKAPRVLWLSLLVAAILAPLSACAQTPAQPVDAATVEALALYYAEESMRRIRVPWILKLVYPGGESREEEIEKIRRNPPKFAAGKTVYPFGDKNALSFVFDEERKILSCRYLLSKKEGVVGGWGLTGPEMAAVLNENSSRREMGKSDWAYDPVRDAVGLRRDFTELPGDREEFYREVDRLMKVGNKWFNGRFVDRLVPLVEARRPPDSAVAGEDEFSAKLVLRHFSAELESAAHYSARYLRGWDRPWGYRPPRVVSDRELSPGRTMFIYIHFEGAENEGNGSTAVDATVRILKPDGSSLVGDLDVPLWRGEAPPDGHLQIGMNNVSFSVDDEEPKGTWRAEARVCESGRGRCLEVSHDLVVGD